MFGQIQDMLCVLLALFTPLRELLSLILFTVYCSVYLAVYFTLVSGKTNYERMTGQTAICLTINDCRWQ